MEISGIPEVLRVSVKIRTGSLEIQRRKSSRQKWAYRTGAVIKMWESLSDLISKANVSSLKKQRETQLGTLREQEAV